MLDELLGRAGLKERIAELEEEKRHLERRAEAEEERRSEAASARQAAEERVNRLEDRVADLEGQLDRVGDEAAAPEFRDTVDLRGDRLTEVLSRLRSVSTGPEGALTAMVGPDAVPGAVASAVGDREALVRRAAPCLVCVDDAGLVAAALDPPLAPEPFATWADGFRIEEAWVRPTSGTAVALVRSDLFALGTFDGEGWTVAATLDSEVMNDHSKGGFSQSRFERRRDDQIEEHLDRCEAALDEHLGDTNEGTVGADRLICLGERTVLGRFEDRADRTATVDASGDPEDAFDAAVRKFFSTRLYLL